MSPNYSRPRVWYWPPWQMTNPLRLWVWRGGDEFGRRTIALQLPLAGAVIVAVSR